MAADLYELAATGSVEAQSALLDNALALRGSGHVRPIEALAAAEVYARLAAANTSLGDVSFANIRRLASVLMMRSAYERMHGNPALAATCDAEALTLLDGAADLGDELAGRVLAEAASVLPRDGFELVQQVRAS